MLTLQPAYYRPQWRIPGFTDWLVFAGCLFIGSLAILVPLALFGTVGFGFYTVVTAPRIPSAALYPLVKCRGMWS